MLAKYSELINMEGEPPAGAIPPEPPVIIEERERPRNPGSKLEYNRVRDAKSGALLYTEVKPKKGHLIEAVVLKDFDPQTAHARWDHHAFDRGPTEEGQIMSSYDPTAGAIADTEKEIFWESASKANSYEPDNDFDQEMERGSEGWDGELTSEAEGFEMAVNGAPEGYLGDKPLEFMREEALREEVRQLRAQVGDNSEAVAESRRIEAQSQRDMRDLQVREMLSQRGVHDAGIQSEIIGAMDQMARERDAANAQVQQFQTNRIQESMEAAHERYGRDFLDTYTALTTMDPNSPLAREIVRSITNSADPGEAMMQLHGNDLLASLGAGRVSPPFMGRPAGRLTRTYTDENYETNSGYGNERAEADIFDSIHTSDADWSGFSHGRR